MQKKMTLTSLTVSSFTTLNKDAAASLNGGLALMVPMTAYKHCQYGGYKARTYNC